MFTGEKEPGFQLEAKPIRASKSEDHHLKHTILFLETLE
jgi:hypothetical protein